MSAGLERRSLVRFVAGFALAFGLLELGYLYVALGSAPYQGYLETLARLTFFVAGALGYDVEWSGTFVLADEGVIEIVPGCDALQPMMLFGAGILAWPSSWLRRLVALGAGLAVLFALNLVRLATLFVIQVEAPERFDLAHMSVWPVILIVSTTALWFVCLARMPVAEPARPVDS